MAQDLLAALGLILVIEGSLYALFPETMKRMILAVAALDPARLRNAGLTAAVAGVGLVWLVRG